MPVQAFWDWYLLVDVRMFFPGSWVIAPRGGFCYLISRLKLKTPLNWELSMKLLPSNGFKEAPESL